MTPPPTPEAGPALDAQISARDVAVDYVTAYAYKCLDPASFHPGDDLTSACEEAVDLGLAAAARAGHVPLSNRDQHGISTGLAIWLASELEM